MRVRSSNPFHRRGMAATERNPTAAAVPPFVPTLWAVEHNGTNALVRQATVTGDPANLTVTYMPGSSALNASFEVMCIASLSNTHCLLGVRSTIGNQARLLQVSSSGTITELWSLATGTLNTFIADIYMASEDEFAFILRNDVSNPPNEVYYSSFGTITDIGRGATGDIDLFAIAIAGSRIYVQHDNIPDSVLSYTDDLGVTWGNVPGTAINQFATGDYGYITLVPDGLGTTRIYYSNANGGGGIQTPFIESGIVTLNPQMTGILDSSFLETGFYQQDTKRLLLDRTHAWNSVDKGATWQSILPPGLDLIGQMRLHRGFSVLPRNDYYALASGGNLLWIATDYQTFQAFVFPDGNGVAVSWIGGRS